ncbi:MAG: hypothetical protein ACD_46C00314G0001 [uncultured bacterium]|nr:MAG: hypothetical protein ACD_46C00314G0001 [uncultured bacterium]
MIELSQFPKDWLATLQKKLNLKYPVTVEKLTNKDAEKRKKYCDILITRAKKRYPQIRDFYTSTNTLLLFYMRDNGLISSDILESKNISIKSFVNAIRNGFENMAQLNDISLDSKNRLKNFINLFAHGATPNLAVKLHLAHEAEIKEITLNLTENVKELEATAKTLNETKSALNDAEAAITSLKNQLDMANKTSENHYSSLQALQAQLEQKNTSVVPTTEPVKAEEQATVTTETKLAEEVKPASEPTKAEPVKENVVPISMFKTPTPPCSPKIEKKEEVIEEKKSDVSLR